jgi:type III restriction enzyme
MDRIKTALNKFFVKSFKFENDDPEFHKVVLNPANITKISAALALAREEYKRKVVAKDVEREMETLVWNVPKILSYNSKYKAKSYKNSIMSPYYSRYSESSKEEDSKVEMEFIEYLESSKSVEWWFKNGRGEVNYFAVPYKDKHGEMAAFYVDFIIRLKKGGIWLLDTKKGQTAEDAKERAEGLAKYIKGQKKKGKKLLGGIVIPVDDQWRYNDNEKYVYNPNNQS